MAAPVIRDIRVKTQKSDSLLLPDAVCTNNISDTLRNCVFSGDQVALRLRAY